MTSAGALYLGVLILLLAIGVFCALISEER